MRPSEHEPINAPPRSRVARNPDPDSRLPYLIWMPIEGGLVLKARETWPRASRVFCAQDATPWDENAGLLDDAPVLLCRRRGAAIDLVPSGDLVANAEDGPGGKPWSQNSSRPLGEAPDPRHRYS